LQGDWAIAEDAIIKADWLRYYDVRGELLLPLDSFRQTASWLCRFGP